VNALLRWLWNRRPVSRRAELLRVAKLLNAEAQLLGVTVYRSPTDYGRGQVRGLQDAWVRVIERSGLGDEEPLRFTLRWK
jgi:hypothetical protein